MKHLDFIIWFISFPLMVSMTNYIDTKTSLLKNNGVYKKHSDKANFMASFITVLLWYCIGILLF